MILSSLFSRRWQASVISRNFRSNAAIDALSRASEEKITNIALYNYPSFSGAFAALFAHLYHSHLNLPFLVLPFSSIEPIRVEDLNFECLETCYLLDFIGPKGFVFELSRIFQRVVVFDHRKSTVAEVPRVEHCPENLILQIDVEKSSSIAVYDYFSKKLAEIMPPEREIVELVNHEDRDRLATVLKYIEDGDLRRWVLPDIKAFNIGLNKERSKLNCINNPDMFDEMSSIDLIAKGKSYSFSRKDAANKLLGKAFRIRLGRGFYGECLGIRADGHSDLSNEIGEELSIRSAAAGLRPIGAVVYMQRGNLKMCLRSTDSATDTSEIAKMYGGGGCHGSSSFIIRMDEYNEWISVNWTKS
ncbi:uncharacterized protein LOC131218745 isoform X2 [Magnolia sinica]|uniref:uncharacterized protein LOC131218745 isoform X2 n=1 Tax=Magnolia sinica TaxID=86752 RepID=UPI002659EB72|nr:uncharacterized protein LOC131218745 isoform X2 [Magnolia sinica]